MEQGRWALIVFNQLFNVPPLTKCTPGAEAWSIRQSDGGEWEWEWEDPGEDRMWHYSGITTDTLYSSRGLLHCAAAPPVTLMPVDRGLLELQDQTEALC